MSLSPYRSRVKTLAFIPLFIVAIAFAVRAQTPASQGATPQTPELAEASKIAVQVVELSNKGQYDAALPLARRVVEIREHVLGADHPRVGDAVQNLAAVQFGRKNYGEAESLYKQALKIYEKAYGPDSVKLIPALDKLGWLGVYNGNLRQAEETLLRTLAICEKAYGPDNIEVAQSTHMLAQFYDQTAQYAKAIEYHKRTIAIKEKVLGPNTPKLADDLKQCACALRQVNKNEEAEQMIDRMGSIVDPEEKEKEKGHVEQVTGTVLQGHAIYRQEPLYPAAAKRSHFGGTVIVEVTVDESGKVIHAEASCGPAVFRDVSAEAARKWRFTPTKLNGEPVKVIGTITFNYHP